MKTPLQLVATIIQSKFGNIYTGEEIKTLKGHTDDVNCMTVRDEKTIIFWRFR